MADYHLLPKGPSKALESFPRKEGPCKEWKYPRNWVKLVMAFLDRVVSLIARGPWHWDWWPLEEGAWPLQIMEKVMVDSNFRRRPWRPSRKGGRSRWPSLIMGNGRAHRLDSPLWAYRQEETCKSSTMEAINDCTWDMGRLS